jgi:hypothetical protein
LALEKAIGESKKRPGFVNSIFPRVFTRLVIGKNFNEHLLQAIKEFYELYHDVRYNALLTIRYITNSSIVIIQGL